MKKTLLAATMAAAVLQAPAALARDTISVVGSSTVYPFTTVVAERFGKTTSFRTPKIESTGTGGGMKLFCQGVGAQYPDITNASRRIKSSEFEMCQKNGVKDILEVNIGYDGIVLANSRKSPVLELSTRDLFLAMAKDVPDPKGGEKLVANPYKTWKDVNPALRDVKIEVLGPPPTSGTRDAFVELAMEGGCTSFAWIKALKDSDEDRYAAICHGMREDGAFIEAGENDNLIVQKLKANKSAFGVFGYSFLEENEDSVQGAVIDGKAPSFETIADGSYEISRPLYIYAKKAHIGVVPGLEEFLAEFVSKKAMGEEGYLSDRGLIPLPSDEYQRVVSATTEKSSMSL